MSRTERRKSPFAHPVFATCASSERNPARRFHAPEESPSAGMSGLARATMFPFNECGQAARCTSELPARVWPPRQRKLGVWTTSGKGRQIRPPFEVYDY